MTRFEIGYRLHVEADRIGRYKAPYTEIGAFETLAEANAAVNQMLRDGFGNIAEIRIVEHRNYQLNGDRPYWQPTINS